MKKIILGAVLLVLIIAGASFAYDRFADDYAPSEVIDPVEKPETEKTEAPDFTVFDMDGNEVKLSDFKGKLVIANFWATWCGPCRSEMPGFDAVYKEYGDKIVFLMVNLPEGETAEDIRRFVKEGGYTFPVYIDSKNDAAITYGINSVPATLFVDREGFIAGAISGAMNENTLRQYAETLFRLP